MITSRADGHAHLWYHVPYCSIENVLEMATKVRAYKYCACVLALAENDSRYWLSRVRTKMNPSSCESENAVGGDLLGVEALTIRK